MVGTWRHGVAVGGLVLGVGVLASACGSGGGHAAASPAAQSATTVTVRTVHSAHLGTILVDAAGRTLYRFTSDHGTRSACTGSCSGLWPALTVATGATPTGGAGVSGLTAVRQADGAHQVSYHGHLLYTYAGDSGPGQTNGQGVDGTWFVVSATGTTPTTTPAGSSAPASTGSGDGY